ncbi:hypothetical protein QQF64_009148, partial [Cirrhinus molitorella]
MAFSKSQGQASSLWFGGSTSEPVGTFSVIHQVLVGIILSIDLNVITAGLTMKLLRHQINGHIGGRQTDLLLCLSLQIELKDIIIIIIMSKEARPSWDSPMQFVLACVSYAVGLGNVWRFPYLCQMHGGGGFLIPYLLMLVLEGIPLFCMELAIGQKMRLGSIGAWTAISPYLGGLGIASVVTSMYLCLYYNVINAWSFWYLFHSFQSVLPWAECPVNANRTGYLEECEVASPTQYFFYRETLNISSSIDENGGIHMGQALCLLLAWIIVYLFIVRGVKSTGMVVYFTATFPYVVLIIYLIRGVTLHGAWNGVKYMFTPKLEQLANPQTWINAATQIFFSLGLGFGSLIAFASYNHHNNNFERQAVAVSLINSGTSVFASIVTFAIYGFKATFNYENCLE